MPSILIEVGYLTNPGWFRIYSMHLKAGDGSFTPSDSATRTVECTNIRTTLNNTNVSFLQYQVIPIVVLIVISVGVLGTALLTARDFEHGRAKMLLLSPAGGWALVVGRLLGGTLITIGLVAPLVALGFLTHHIPYCAEESVFTMS